MDRFKKLKKYLDTNGIDLSSIPEQNQYKVPSTPKMAPIPDIHLKKLAEEDEDEE